MTAYPAYAAPAPPRRRRTGRVILTILLIIVLALVGFLVYLDFSMKRVDALGQTQNAPAAGPGTNWLMVGSDSREGLTPEQEKQLATGDEGDAGGQRSDTMMLLHIPSGSGKPTLVSLPRDSYLAIPGHGKNKLNAAFAFGGPSLLVQTVEQATNVHIDHFAQIGFAGFAGVVDAIGGVDMCVDKAMKDPKAGIDLQPGCQTLDGPKALGYVRTRATARADLDRVVHQRQFLGALAKKATSPGVLLNPFDSIPMAVNGIGLLTVDNGDHIWNVAGMAWAIGAGQDGLVTTTVPLGRSVTVSGVGDAVTWDPTKSKQLFGAIAQDQQVPEGALVTG